MKKVTQRVCVHGGRVRLETEDQQQDGQYLASLAKGWPIEPHIRFQEWEPEDALSLAQDLARAARQLIALKQ